MTPREHVQLVHGLNCGCIVHRHERATAAAKVQTAAAPQPTLKLEPAVARAPKVERAVVPVARMLKVRKVTVRKTEPKSKPLTNSEHQAKWRAAHPDAARRQAAERMKGLRAQRKTQEAR